ncbi:MAG: hypothetical protein MJZ61_07245 [Bacteroidales bacterium]|nr:hypothetical protein [Bacteroidales bacterium]
MNNREYISYEGKRYPVRFVNVDGGKLMVSVESLNTALFAPGTIEYRNEEARRIDESIFFFLDDENIYTVSDDDLLRIARSVLFVGELA